MIDFIKLIVLKPMSSPNKISSGVFKWIISAWINEIYIATTFLSLQDIEYLVTVPAWQIDPGHQSASLSSLYNIIKAYYIKNIVPIS